MGAIIVTNPDGNTGAGMVTISDGITGAVSVTIPDTELQLPDAILDTITNTELQLPDAILDTITNTELQLPDAVIVAIPDAIRFAVADTKLPDTGIRNARFSYHARRVDAGRRRGLVRGLPVFRGRLH